MEVEKWRFTGCATSFLYQPHESAPSFPTDKHKLFLKFKALPHQIGYEALLTDFNGHLWRETLFGCDLQDRLKSEASGLEIETPDLLSLLRQMCQNFLESSCETSSDLKNLILRASVKIGFIKLKWTFKAESCGGYAEMIKEDFLLPFFANLRDDKLIRDEFGEDELDKFYEIVIPNLKKESQETTMNNTNNYSPLSGSITETTDSLITNLSTTPPPIPIELAESPDTEELKRKALEEQLQASKKKKKKLI